MSTLNSIHSRIWMILALLNTGWARESLHAWWTSCGKDKLVRPLRRLRSVTDHPSKMRMNLKPWLFRCQKPTYLTRTQTICMTGNRVRTMQMTSNNSCKNFYWRRRMQRQVKVRRPYRKRSSNTLWMIWKLQRKRIKVVVSTRIPNTSRPSKRTILRKKPTTTTAETNETSRIWTSYWT